MALDGYGFDEMSSLSHFFDGLTLDPALHVMRDESRSEPALSSLAWASISNVLSLISWSSTTLYCIVHGAVSDDTPFLSFTWTMEYYLEVSTSLNSLNIYLLYRLLLSNSPAFPQVN